jgi:methylated-DNA-[protein]-cysteine S-methyltransferase
MSQHIADELAAPAEMDEPTRRRLHERLVSDAAAEGILDVAYRTWPSPVGDLLVAATAAGLVRVAYPEDGGHEQVLVELAEQVSPRVLRAPSRLEGAVRQLSEYFHGDRRRFDLVLDYRLAHGFRREVMTHLVEIEYGHTASYAEVADASGHPRAVRAVGTACARNPLPVVVPCHRVVRSDGTIGQYAGGPEAKRTLLELESR